MKVVTDAPSMSDNVHDESFITARTENGNVPMPKLVSTSIGCRNRLGGVILLLSLLLMSSKAVLGGDIPGVDARPYFYDSEGLMVEPGKDARPDGPAKQSFLAKSKVRPGKLGILQFANGTEVTVPDGDDVVAKFSRKDGMVTIGRNSNFRGKEEGRNLASVTSCTGTYTFWLTFAHLDGTIGLAQARHFLETDCDYVAVINTFWNYDLNERGPEYFPQNGQWPSTHILTKVCCDSPGWANTWLHVSSGAIAGGVVAHDQSNGFRSIRSITDTGAPIQYDDSTSYEALVRPLTANTFRSFGQFLVLSSGASSNYDPSNRRGCEHAEFGEYSVGEIISNTFTCSVDDCITRRRLQAGENPGILAFACVESFAWELIADSLAAAADVETCTSVGSDGNKFRAFVGVAEDIHTLVRNAEAYDPIVSAVSFGCSLLADFAFDLITTDSVPSRFYYLDDYV